MLSITCCKHIAIIHSVGTNFKNNNVIYNNVLYANSRHIKIITDFHTLDRAEHAKASRGEAEKRPASVSDVADTGASPVASAARRTSRSVRCSHHILQ